MACVNRAVVTIHVDNPAFSAIMIIDKRCFLLDEVQFERLVISFTDIVPKIFRGSNMFLFVIYLIV